MRAIWQKARADLWGRRWQALLILTTLGASAALLYLGLLTLTTTSAPLEHLLERTRGPHAYFLIAGGDGVPELTARLSGDPAVTGSELRRVYGTELLLPGRDENAEVLLQPVVPGSAAMMGHVIVAGRGLEPGRSREAVLGVSLARYFGLTVGDQIELALPDGPQSLTLVGLSADSLWCAYPTCAPQNLYILPETLASLTAGVPAEFYLLGLRLKEPAEADAFLSRAVKEAGQVQIVTAISWLTIRTGTQLINGLTASSLLVFALTAIAAAALITVNLVSGAVLAQFREIAVMKVLGFTAPQVQLLYALQNLLLGAAGAALGVGAGHLAAGPMLVALAENMGNPDVLRFQPGLGALVVALIAGVAVIVGLLAAWPAVALRPAAALRDGFAAPRARTPWPVRLLNRLGAPAPIILGVKDVTARPGRALLTMASLTLCIVTITISAGVGRFSEQLGRDLDLLGMPYDLLVGVKEPYTAAEAEAVARSLPGIEAIARRTQLGVMAARQEAAFRLEAVEGDWRSIPWQVTEGRLPEEPGEIMLASGILRQLGVAVDETLELQVGGQTVTWRISGSYRNPMELGRVGLTSMETLRTVLPDAKASGLVIRMQEGADAAALREALLAQSNYRLTASLMRTFITGGFMQDLLEQIRVLALLMAVIAALSALNTALLTAREQIKEVGIRKAMGMTPLQVLAAVGAGGAWLGMIGSLVGVPGGLWLHGIMTQMMSRQLSDGSVPLDQSPAMIAGLLLGGTALAVTAALPAALWAGRIVTAQALRAAE